MNEDDLCCLLRDLDRSLINGLPTGDTERLVQRWNGVFANHEPLGKKKKKDNKAVEIADDLGLHLVADVIRNKGLRLRGLERALNVESVVVSGSVDIKQNFFKAIKGDEPLDVGVTGGMIKLKIKF
ncbi:MAG: hypothetical protein KC503_38760 [Myxococcales bacterium]|nr:hypothetical protein [Myxococcales bacterium]